MQISDQKQRSGLLGHPWLVALGAIILIVAGLVIFLGAFGKRQEAAVQPAAAGVPVTLAPVTVEDVPLLVDAIGTVEAFSTVSITSQANGQMMKVYFTEGQYVKKGDMLFTIDPRPSEADVAGSVANQSKAVGQQRQAEANMAKDQAQARNAEAEAVRYERLYKQGIISKEQADQMRTNADALAAVVSADEAAIASEKDSVNAAKAAVTASKVQLSYTEIRAPIAGRTGSLMIHQGNVIKANDTNPLVVINQVNPIYVSFAVPEAQLPDVKRYMAAGSVKVAAAIPNDGGAPEQGALGFIDNKVDPATGTVKLKATFANAQQRLWPGQFVNVSVTLTTQPNAVVVPSQAVQTGQRGRYVFVVKPDQTVELRAVTVQRAAGAKTIVASGLAPGETVVTDGQLRLRPGTKVKAPETAGEPKAQSPDNP